MTDAIFLKIHFCPNVGQKGSEVGCFTLFWKSCHLFFRKAFWFFTSHWKPNVKILVLELVPIRWYYLLWWAWWGMPKVPKIKSLQYLCNSNISKKKWGINMIFCMKINRKVLYKLRISFLLVIARYAQSTQNRKCL